ncbi:MAG TPA: CBS domain-containing protein [Streptosporangiaceae bacterium]
MTSGTPAAWLVRGGEAGGREQRAMAEGLAFVGWAKLGDISDYTRDSIRLALKAAYPDYADNLIANNTGQLWRFANQIAIGDYVVMPLHTKPGYVAIGIVAGPYEYRKTEPIGFRHIRAVEWLQKDIPRDSFRPDLRASITSLLTVCGLTRNDAARRVAYLAEHRADPGMDGAEEITTSEELLADAATRDQASPRRLTIRDFLEHWGQTRRTGTVIALIRSDLADKGLTTRPPFTEGPIEGEIEIVPVDRSSSNLETTVRDSDNQATEDVAEQVSASARIGSLPPPDLVAVSPESSLLYTRTVMLERQFSQLAVIDGNGTLHGAISWESMGKAYVASEYPKLADAIAPATVVDHDALLLDQIEVIYDRGFVFVRGPDRIHVTGIVTAADLTRQFGNLARPFMLIEEVEIRLRLRADEVYTLTELRDAVQKHRRDAVTQAADFTLRDYCYLLRPDENWAKLAWNVDQEYFIECLDKVVEIRNDLMHFTTDDVDPAQYEAVEGLLEMLRAADPRQ